MKTNFAATAFVLASALIANATFAADVAPLTREQVRAEYFQALKDGTLTKHSEAGAPATPYTVSNVTRAQVQADYLQATKDGSLPKITEAGVTYPATAPSALTRAQVRAEYFQAVKEGTLVQNSEAGAPAMQMAKTSRPTPVSATSTLASHNDALPVTR